MSSRGDTQTRYVHREILTNSLLWFSLPHLPSSIYVTILPPSSCLHSSASSSLPSLFLPLPLPSLTFLIHPFPCYHPSSLFLPPLFCFLFHPSLFIRLLLSSLPSLQSIPILSEPFTTPITSKQAGIPLASTPLPPAARAGKIVVTTCPQTSFLYIRQIRVAPSS